MEKSETIDETDVRPPALCDAGAGEPGHRIRELTAALAARDRFIAHVGHELRNSIAPMLLLAEQFAQLAVDPDVKPSIASRAAVLTRNLHKCVSTIDRVAEVADLRRGKLLLSPDTVDLVEVVNEVCRELVREAVAAGADLVVDVEHPALGRWDRARVKQIAANLIANAIRHSGGGRVEISVRGGATDAELVVRDHGPGIALDALPRLFDDADLNLGKRTGRLGIGLWIVKTLCTAMGGAVTAENCASGGARFCVALPRG